jgi:hypothetical protein
LTNPFSRPTREGKPGFLSHHHSRIVQGIVRLGLALFFLLQLSAFAGDEPKSPPVRIVADPVETYYREQLVDQGMAENIGSRPTFLLTVEADFDCDGRLDLAVTNSFDVGARSGTWWSIFLSRADGTHAEVGSVGTKSNRFKITPDPKGGGNLAVMLRAGPGDLVVEFYRVTQRGLKKTSVEKVQIAEEDVGPDRIDEVFGKGYSELAAKKISLEELKKKFPK